MTTASAILVAARAKIALIPTSRDATDFFLEHLTSDAFERSPVAGSDGFEVIGLEPTILQGFGETGSVVRQFMMIVKLGHMPSQTDKLREQYRQEDVERLADLLESFAWPSGTMAMFYESTEVDKSNPNWWLSLLRFRCVYNGAERTT